MPATKKIGSETIIRLRAPLVTSERDNNTEYRDWENAEETEFNNVMVQPFKMAEKLNFELEEGREFVRTAFRFLLLGEHDFLYSDHILWSGYELLIFGHPQKWRLFSGDMKYTGFIARIQEG